MDKYLHWYEAFWGKAQEQIHEGLGPKWTISYQCGDMWCPRSLQVVSEPCPGVSHVDDSSECRTKVEGPGLITMGSMDELYWTDGVLRMLHVRRASQRGGEE